MLILTGVGYAFWLANQEGGQGQPIFFHRDNRLNLKTYPKPVQNQEAKRKHNPPQDETDENKPKKPFDISICQDNPNAPDLLDRQLRRAATHDESPCAKIKLNMKF